MLIEARGITRSYRLAGREVPVLQGIDLALERGAFVAVTGASGSGKSTLLHILGALDRADGGSYRFEGHEVSALGDRERSRLRASRIGFVFQAYHLLPQLSVLENVLLPFQYSSGVVASEEREARARAALGRVGLSERLAHRPSELSGGELQRAAIARAMVARPSVLLADEPTGNLDSRTGATVLDMLLELNATGTALLLVTHDREIAAWAPRKLHLRDGRFDA